MLTKMIDPRDGPDDWEAPQRLVPRNSVEHDGCCEEYRLNAPAKKCGNCPRQIEHLEQRPRTGERSAEVGGHSPTTLPRGQAGGSQ
jgi:hypothetical protein